MCGIVACILGPSRHPSAQMIGRQMGPATRTLEHRGPDGVVTWTDGRCHLGVAPLSFFEPNRLTQPFHASDGRVHAVCNGELYNHAALRSMLPRDIAWRTESDCEVLLHLYS